MADRKRNILLYCLLKRKRKKHYAHEKLSDMWRYLRTVIDFKSFLKLSKGKKVVWTLSQELTWKMAKDDRKKWPVYCDMCICVSDDKAFSFLVTKIRLSFGTHLSIDLIFLINPLVFRDRLVEITIFIGDRIGGRIENLCRNLDRIPSTWRLWNVT